MIKVRLSFYDGDHAPGDVVEVDKQKFAQLVRDGRVAEVLDRDESTDVNEPLVENESKTKLAEDVKDKRRRTVQDKAGE